MARKSSYNATSLRRSMRSYHRSDSYSLKFDSPSDNWRMPWFDDSQMDSRGDGLAGKQVLNGFRIVMLIILTALLTVVVGRVLNGQPVISFQSAFATLSQWGTGVSIPLIKSLGNWGAFNWLRDVIQGVLNLSIFVSDGALQVLNFLIALLNIITGNG